MNTTPFFRILWKEYRTQRAFWISVAAAILLIHLAILADPWITRDERAPALFAVALILAALYALGTSATLFATERENGTYDFLQALPVGPWAVFLGKTVFAVLSAAAMVGVAWILARLLAGGLPEKRDHLALWAYCGLMAVEFLAWGILFSLLFRRTIVAACLAGTAALVVLGWFVGDSRDPLHNFAGRLLVVGLVTAANLIVANYWLREKRLRRMPDARSAPRGGRPVLGPRFGRLGRLVWQEVRRSKVLTIAILATMASFLLFLWAASLGNEGGWINRYPAIAIPPLVALMVAGHFSPLLLGSTLFLGDQTGCHFRFLAERGFPPRLVWLSRQIRGLAVMLLGMLLLPVVAMLLRAGRALPADAGFEFDCLVGYVVAAYACGQLCSMGFRGGILAAFCGAILTAIVCGWAGLMYFFRLSWLWTVAPLLLAFMAATWLHAPNWLLERKTWRTWLRPASVVAIPTLAILVAIPLVRIYEIPWVDPGFDSNGLTWPISPEEEETLALYRRALALHAEATTSQNAESSDGTRREAEKQAIALALEASRRPLPGYYPDPPFGPVAGSEHDLVGPVLARGKALQDEGKLDAALDYYLAAARIALHAHQRSPWLWQADSAEFHVLEQLTYWAAERGQTSERVLKAMKALDELWRTPPTYCDEIKYCYLRNLRALEGRGESPGRNDNFYFDWWSFMARTRWLPWERARALRILNLLTEERIAHARAFAAAMAAGGFLESPPDAARDRALSRDFFTDNYVMANLPPIRLDGFLAIERYRRATRLVLALEAWRLDHGSLPKSLDDLKGKYLDQIPVDPFTGDQFGYEPQGISDRVEWNLSITPPENPRTMEPGQPFVGQRYSGPEHGPSGSVNARGVDGWKGWVFPIPEAGGKRDRPRTEAGKPKTVEASEARPAGAPPSPPISTSPVKREKQ